MTEGTAPPAEELIERVRALPAAAPLLSRLGDPTGVYLVGGAVRDILLGGSPTDLDLVVEADAGELASRLTESPRRHDRFGTATVQLEGRSYDIATARRESYSRPGALPDVEPAGIEEDLARRDFAVNAMAIALGGLSPGDLHAAAGALEDLAARQLRVLHERSFEDDPTRLLRLVRYATRLGFEIEEHTLLLAERAIAAGVLGSVSGSRLGMELRLLLREPDPIAGLELLRKLGLDRAIDDALGLRDPELARRALELLPGDGRADLLLLALATSAVAPERLARLLDELEFEHGDRDIVLATVTDLERATRELRSASLPSEVARTLRGAPSELAALAGALGAESQAREWLDRLRHVRLEIDGADLLAAGIVEGPAVGSALSAALSAKLDGRVSGREQELAEALREARASR